MDFSEPTITRESGAPGFPGPAAQPTASEAAAAADDGRRAGGRRLAASRPGPAPGRPRPAGPDPALVQFGPRAIVLRSASWKATSDIPAGELAEWSRKQHAAWYRRRRSRDLVLLAILYEHRYLTTEHLRALFFPSLRTAQLRLRWLAVEQRLLMRWQHYEPLSAGPRTAPYFWGVRQRSSVFLLTDLGAALVAAYRKLDVKDAVRRSFYTAERERTLEHSLETNGFWVSLAAAARDIPDQGLYHWVGDDAMRRNHQERGADVAPDGWGRYLIASQEVRFSLEWDRGTEAPQRLGHKAAAHLGLGAGGNVLVVVPGATRESSIRAAIQRVLPARPAVRFWTTHAGLIREHGPLGALWLDVDGGEARRSLVELPARPGAGLRVDDCLCKPGWWDRRPGGGEGA